MSTSDYKSDALVAQKKLNEVSPTMCLAKWNQVSLHLPTGLTNSCYHPPLHKIDATQLENNPAALHNTAEKIEQRKLEEQQNQMRNLIFNLKVQVKQHSQEMVTVVQL